MTRWTLKGRCGGSSKQRKGPLRKIVEEIVPGNGIFSPPKVRLECGHECYSAGAFRARCVACAKDLVPDEEVEGQTAP